MKIVSWNVNGLRAVWRKEALQDFVAEYNPDILGLQETKSTPDQLHADIKNHKEYITFFESATNRKGYSGVALYSKHTPEKVTGTLAEKGFRDDDVALLLLNTKIFIL